MGKGSRVRNRRRAAAAAGDGIAPIAPVVGELDLFAGVFTCPVEVAPLAATIAIIRQHAMGNPANNCVAVCYQLAGALRHLGFDAELVAACAAVASRQDGRSRITDVGVWRQPPITRDDGTTNGHAVVWVGSFRRLVDLTIGQDATLQRASRLDPSVASPIVMPLERLPAFAVDGPTPPLIRGPFVITYLLFPEWSEAFTPLWQHNPNVAALLDEGALSLAHATLDILRMVEERVPSRRAILPHLRDLLDGRAMLPPLPA